ncbi:MAG TPA: hypothetical protein DCO77_09005 [Nitrospiraceae bacterium]|nr:hypothetical protein [Nitrospiraceae bacterium]
MMKHHVSMGLHDAALQFKFTPKKAFFILVANTLIALFIFLDHTGNRFLENFIISQCIGTSIALAVFSIVHVIRTRSCSFRHDGWDRPQKTRFEHAAEVIGRLT